MLYAYSVQSRFRNLHLVDLLLLIVSGGIVQRYIFQVQLSSNYHGFRTSCCHTPLPQQYPLQFMLVLMLN